MNTENYDVHYYYARDNKPNNPGRHPLACVCIIKDKTTGKYSRGISICSAKEKKFNKQAARGLAFQRAMFAGNEKDRHIGKSVRVTTNTAHAISALHACGIPIFEYETGSVVVVSAYDVSPSEVEVSVCDER